MAPDRTNPICRLAELRIHDYLKARAMPDFVEPLLASFLGHFRAAPETEQRRLMALIPPGSSWVFGWYARKIAGLAVRERSLVDLENGLAAVAVAAATGDFRDMLAPLALLYDSSLRLGQDARALLLGAPLAATPTGRNLFSAFLDRSAEQKSIHAFGFSEGMGPQGFDYVPLLPEFGGPSPLAGAER